MVTTMETAMKHVQEERITNLLKKVAEHPTDRNMAELEELARDQLKDLSTEARKAQAKADREGSNKYRQAFQKSLATRPKATHRQIFSASDDDHAPSVQPLTRIRNTSTGTLEHSSEGMLAAFKGYYDTLMAPRFGAKTGEYMRGTEDSPFPWEAPGAPDPYKLAPEDSMTRERAELIKEVMDEVSFYTLIKHPPNSKQAGPDGIPNEVIKILPLPLKEAILDLMTLMWAKGYTPDSWKHSHTVLLYKEGKDPTNPASYRPVGLANTLYKLWTATVTRVISKYGEGTNLLSTSQEGFRKERNTHRQLQNAINTISDAALTKKNLYAMYIDFSSAFNMLRISDRNSEPNTSTPGL